MALLVVLGGAGFHAPELESKYRRLLRDSCTTGLTLDNFSPIHSVIETVSVLEDSPLTNAGYGSSLTRVGTVETDAIIIDGSSGHFGAVTALENVKNPVKASASLLFNQLSPPGNEESAGLIQPCCLAGHPALDWSISKNLEICKGKKNLIASERKLEFLEYSKIIRKHGVCATETECRPQDTVGAVCIGKCSKTSQFRICAASSSGGAVMKRPGRVGPAGCIGTNCWCEQMESEEGTKFCAVIASGQGEYILSKVVARSIALLVSNHVDLNSLPLIGVVSDVLKTLHVFEKSHHLGIVVVYGRQVSSEKNSDVTVDIAWAHSTPSMAIAFGQTDLAEPSSAIRPTVKISRNANLVIDKPIIEGRTFILSLSCST